MQVKDVVQMIISVVVPMMALVLAQSAMAKREKSNRAMNLFYDLVSHVHEYARAFYSYSSHARRHGVCAEQMHQYRSNLDPTTDHIRDRLAKEWSELGEESVRIGATIRKAAASLEADSLLLKMLFGPSARSLIASIDELRNTSLIFEGKVPEYFDECYPIEKDMKPRIAKLLHDVSEFWTGFVGQIETA